MLKEIAVFIAGKFPGKWVIDVNFFAGQIPSETIAGGPPPDRLLALLEDGGGVVYGDLPDRVDKAVQLLSRAEDYFKARDDASELHAAFHGTAGWKLPVLTSGEAFIVETITAVSIPAPIGQDDKERYLFSTNYVWIIQRL